MQSFEEINFGLQWSEKCLTIHNISLGLVTYPVLWTMPMPKIYRHAMDLETASKGGSGSYYQILLDHVKTGKHLGKMTRTDSLGFFLNFRASFKQNRSD